MSFSRERHRGFFASTPRSSAGGRPPSDTTSSNTPPSPGSPRTGLHTVRKSARRERGRAAPEPAGVRGAPSRQCRPRRRCRRYRQLQQDTPSGRDSRRTPASLRRSPHQWTRRSRRTRTQAHDRGHPRATPAARRARAAPRTVSSQALSKGPARWPNPSARPVAGARLVTVPATAQLPMDTTRLSPCDDHRP